MNDDQKIIMPNGGIILNRVHLEIGEGFVKHSYELDERFTNRRNFIMGGFLYDCFRNTNSTNILFNI